MDNAWSQDRETQTWTVTSGPQSSIQMKIHCTFNLEINVPDREEE